METSRRSIRTWGGEVSGATTAALIDEIPVLAVLGAATEQGLTVRDASELRIKETDRIQTVIENLRRLGVTAEELADGLVVPGRQKFRAARFDSFGDHRIAMAFAVAALAANGESVIDGAEAASVSFPEFWDNPGGDNWGPGVRGRGSGSQVIVDWRCGADKMDRDCEE